MQNAFYAIVLLAATVAWGYFFYKKDYHPQPVRIVIQIFGIGLFSMLPVFGYKMIYENFLPLLAEYKLTSPLFTHPLLVGIGFFALNLLLLNTILFTLSAGLTATLTIFKHDTLSNIKSALKESSFDFVAVSMMIGLLVYLETIAETFLGIDILQAVLGTILFLGVIEEYVKHLIVRLVDDKKLKDIDDAITLSLVVGLAFALIETFIYAVKAGDFSLMIYRAFMTLPIHLVASGIFGYYYGLAHFAKPILALNHKKDDAYDSDKDWLPKLLKCKRITAYGEAKMTKGLFLATLFHTIANVLFEISLAYLVVPFVVTGLILLLHLYKESHKEWRLIERKV